MIYLVAFLSVLLVVGSYFRVKAAGTVSAFLDGIAAIVCGWVTGLLLGAGARLGMWAISFFNGTPSRFSIDGTVQVILIFSLLGIGLGLVYEFVLRQPLRTRGLLYGLAITLVTVYPIGQQGAQQLNFSPAAVSLVLFTFFFIAIMFVPYGVALEFCLCRWHKFRDLPKAASAAIPNGS